jgi:Transposase zinc-binding domain
MARPALEVADIFRDHGAAWRAANAGHVSLGQLQVMSAIERCRTAALGGHVAAGEACAHATIAYNSCRNRHCPKCQGAAARDWLAERQAELLPVPYSHLVLTLPAAIADVLDVPEMHWPSAWRSSRILSSGSLSGSCGPYIEAPHEPIRIAPLRLALDDEGLATDGELVAGLRACDVARPQLEGRGLGVDAGLPEADDRVGTTGDDPRRHRLAAGGRVEGIDPERGEGGVHRALEHRHQVRLPLMSTRGRVLIAERWLPSPKLRHPYPEWRFDVMTRGGSPVR